MSEENFLPDSGNRWYDNDPALQRAIEQLRHASDQFQAQVALNIIKIIVEHQMELQTDVPAERLNSALQTSGAAHSQYRRWYDVHETLSSAMQLLADCPEDLKRQMIPSIAQMIETTLQAGA